MDVTATTPPPSPGSDKPRGSFRVLLLILAAGWLLLGSTLLLGLALELGLRGLFTVKDAIRPLPSPDPRVVQDGYDSADWVSKLYKEQAGLEAQWSPYSGFKLKPFDGQFIHVNERSERLTWQSPGMVSQDPEILFLGGSSAWGLGSRDHETIPSYVARELDKMGQRAQTVNAAQVGHVQTQELVELLKRLQAGERPRVVVFYDGVNDVLAALQSRRAGWPQNASNRQAEFNLLARPGPLIGQFVVASARTSAIARLADSTARRLGIKPGATASPDHAFDANSADDVIATCASNMALIDALARQYRFQAVFCWQPVIFTKRQLTDYEREKAAQYDWLKQPLALTRQRLATLEAAQTEHVRFLDLTATLDDEPGLLYVDFCHTTEAPGVLIGQTIAREISRLLLGPLLKTESDGP